MKIVTDSPACFPLKNARKVGRFSYDAKSRNRVELFTVDSDGTSYRKATDDEIVNRALLIANKGMQPGAMLSAPASVREFLRIRLSPLTCEVFGMLLLDNRHRLIEYREVFRGTIDGCSVHPREIMREVMAANAAAVIFFHNHPSGVCEASQADELITHRLRDAVAMIDVRVLDHLIVGSGNILSFAERGML